MTKKPSSKPSKQLKFRAIPVKQGGLTFYLFSVPASTLWSITEINRRSEDKQEGYQRALSSSRVKSVAKYITGKGVIPGSIIVNFDEGEFDTESQQLILPNKKQLGWIIDGQHRLAGAFEAESQGTDMVLPVVGFLKLSNERQVEFFITINKEAKSVPASLYIDLLKDLPRKKSEKELTDERIADITRSLDSDELSPFFQRIIFTRTAKTGEVSLVNFARILRPHISRQSGIIGTNTPQEQTGAINNYFKAIKNIFPSEFNKGIFFRTVGFGAVWRAFPLIFGRALGIHKSFSVAAISKILSEIKGFEFENWLQLGTGSAAEIQAGDDLIATLHETFEGDPSSIGALKLD